MDWELLKQVSRSFYLTLRLLPPQVRETIALAYLLARLSDTKADGAVTDGERRLLAEESALIHALQNSPDRAEITEVWQTIQEGQDFDQDRFGHENSPPLNAEELDRYTYLVAGCVGEFWTKVCAKHLGGFAKLSVAEMTRLGVEYGKALQLINILRDRAADRELGRVYLAEKDVLNCLVRARGGLAQAERYVKALRMRRLRIATALPVLIGNRTLDLIERDPGARRVKVSRWQVWAVLGRSLFY